MMRCGVWLLALLLAGCGLGVPPGDSPEAQCRRQAYDNPTVKALGVQRMGVPNASPQLDFDYDKALHDATDACLRQRGVPLRGGVERVRPY